MTSVLFVACSAVEPEPPTAPEPTSGDFLSKLRAGDLSAANALLAEDVVFFDSSGATTGATAVRARVAPLSAAADARLEKHHAVGRLALSDGALLFVTSAKGAIVTVVRFPPAGTSETPATVAAYQRAWDTAGPARAGLLQQGWADEAWYLDPTTQGHGHAGLERAIAAFRADFPQARLEPGPMQAASGGWLTFPWRITQPGASLDGFDVGRLHPDGRLEFVAGFFSAR